MENLRIFGRLKILDSIRGIAALNVFYHHIFKLNKNFFFENLNDTWFRICDYISSLNQEAVLLFFIISGFSIGLSVSKRPLVNKNILNTYLYKRFKRILPIYWISIFIAFAVGSFLGLLQLRDFSFLNFLGNLFFIQTSSSISNSWAVPYGLNGPLWSLAFEMFFYLLFPLVYLINKKYLTKVNLFVKFGFLLVIVLAGIIINNKLFFMPFFLFLGGFVSWILGYIASNYYTNWKKNNLFFGLNLIAGIIIIIFKDLLPSDTLVVIGKGMLINGIFYFVMVATENRDLTTVQTILNKLFFKIGEGSYAIYALHYPFLILFQYQNIGLFYQVLFVPPFIVLCYHLEKMSILWKMKFLEINYLKLFGAFRS